MFGSSSADPRQHAGRWPMRVFDMSKRVEALTVVAGLTVLAVAVTWPVLVRLRYHIAGDVGDPVLVSWMLAWDADRIRHGFSGIWHAPNFFPYPYTLLYSEHFLGIAIFTAPLQWITDNPVLVYNVAFIASYVITGAGMYVLARSLTGRRDAAIVAAAVFALYPFRASHRSHLQLLVVGWLPLSIWAIHTYFRTRRLRHLLAATVCFLLQALTSGYFAYFGLVPVAIVGVWELWRTRPPVGRLIAHAGVAVVLAAAVMLPIVRAYAELRRESGLRRPLDEIVRQSADLGDYVSASPTLRLWGGLGSGRGEHELFPGFVAVALAIVSIRARPRPRKAGLYFLVLAVAVALSFGPEPRAFGHPIGISGPYGWLLRVIPGLDGIRVPARLAVVAQMALAVLAAFGTAWVIDEVSMRVDRGAAMRAAVTAAITAAIVVEGWAHVGTPEFPPHGDPLDAEAYAYLRSLPRGAAIELPTRAEQLLDEFKYQYMTLVHGHPIVNGHSGYVTPLVVWLRGGHSPLRESGRQRDVVEMLRSIGVRYLVVHRSAYAEPALRDELMTVIDTDPQVIARRSFADVTVAALAPLELASPPAHLEPVPVGAMSIGASHEQDRLKFLFDGDRDSRWLTARPQAGDEWLEVRFDRARDVHVVRLQLGARSFGDYPRELSIDAVEHGASRNLFRGSVLPQLAHGVIADGDYPFIDIVLPPNRSNSLRLSQHGTTHVFFWSIHELQLLEAR